jgi:hypothetical protein
MSNSPKTLHFHSETMHPYRFPEQLKFGHLKVGETFRLLPTGSRWFADPLPGTFLKISPRRYVPCETYLCGLRVVVKPDPTATPARIDSVHHPVAEPRL